MTSSPSQPTRTVENGLSCLTLEPCGIRVKLAGPDSVTQNRARLNLADDLAAVADADGRVNAAAREAARLDSLARCILDWEIDADGQPLPLTHANALRLLKAGVWVQMQVDAFSSDRAAFRGGV